MRNEAEWWQSAWFRGGRTILSVCPRIHPNAGHPLCARPQYRAARERRIIWLPVRRSVMANLTSSNKAPRKYSGRQIVVLIVGVGVTTMLLIFALIMLGGLPSVRPTLLDSDKIAALSLVALAVVVVLFLINHFSGVTPGWRDPYMPPAEAPDQIDRAKKYETVVSSGQSALRALLTINGGSHHSVSYAHGTSLGQRRSVTRKQ